MQRVSHQNVAGLLRESMACRSFSLIENAHQSKPINAHRVSPNNVSDRAQRSCVVIYHHPDVAWPESYFGYSKSSLLARGSGDRVSRLMLNFRLSVQHAGIVVFLPVLGILKSLALCSPLLVR